MKVIVLHGDDTQKSYLRLSRFISTARKRSWEVADTESSSQSFPETISGASLFGNERFFIVNNLSKLSKKDLEFLKKNKKKLEGNLVIYHSSVITATYKKALPSDTVYEEFKLPKLIWVFLDSFKPGNPAKILKDFHKIIETEAPEFVFSLICKQVKDMFWVKADESSLNLPSWRVSKLKKQSEAFRLEKLQYMIAELAEIDYKIKTGKKEIISSIDLLMLKELK